MSEVTKKLQDFGERLAQDGYPSALVEHAVERIDAMEMIIIKQNAEIEGLKGQIAEAIGIACHYSELGESEIKGLIDYDLASENEE